VYGRKADTDVFVIGGGPAGLAAAIAVRRRGLSVTVADGSEPPVDKACGEGLMPETLYALGDLGVKLPPGVGFRFRGIRFCQRDAQVSADFPQGRGIGLRRTALHELLVSEAEKSGVTLLWKSPVVGISHDAVCLPNRSFPARWIVGADGGQSRVRRWADLDSCVANSQRFATRRHYRVRPWSEYVEIYWGPRLQAYVTPVSAYEVCIVAMAMSPDQADFDRALALLPELQKRLACAEIASRERGAVTALQSLAKVWRGNVALIGDASGGVDAITGEGLRLTFRQADSLAAAIERGDLRGYGRDHARISRKPLWMGALMRQLGHYDPLRRRMLLTLSRNPGLFAQLLAIHAATTTVKNIFSAGSHFGWQLLAG